MIIDLVFCLILVLAAVAAYKRGALLSLRGLASFAGSAYLTYLTVSPVTGFIYQKIVRGILIDRIKEAIFSGKAQDADYKWKSYVEQVSAGKTKASEIAEEVADTYLYHSVYPVVQLITAAVLFILFSVLISMLIRALARALRGVRPVRAVDSAAGLVVGIAEGVVLVFVLCVFLGIYVGDSSSASSSAFFQQASDSRMVSYVSDTLLPALQVPQFS